MKGEGNMKINKHFKQIGEIKDRGNIKWQGLFLPEHVEMIRAWREEDNRVEKPDLTDFDFQMIQEELEIAMKRRCTVKIQTWKDAQFHYHEGIVEDIDFRTKVIIYNDSVKNRRIPVDEVISITMLE